MTTAAATHEHPVTKQHNSSLWSLPASCPPACWEPYIHCSTLHPAVVTTQTDGSRDTKYEAPLLLHFTFLRKVRGHFLSLCQSISRTRWGGRVLLTEAAVRRKPTASTLAQHPYSCRHDTAGSLRMNLVFYSKGKTYSGNSNHFSLLL